jgi:hypothetical protein
MADVKISDLTAAAAALTTHQIEVNEGGTSKRVTIAQIQTLLAAVQTGTHEFFVAAPAMTAATTNGPSSGTTELSTNKNMKSTFDFDATTAESVQFSYLLPKGVNTTFTMTFKPVWSFASGSGAVVWEMAAVATSDGDAGDVAFGTGQTSTDTAQTAGMTHIGPESSTITIAGSPATGDFINVRVKRLPADAGDTLGVDAKLLGVLIRYTYTGPNDA